MKNPSTIESPAISTDTLQIIRTHVVADLAAIDQLIIKELDSDVPLMRTITEHIIKSGGKRLRPLVVLLSALALDYQGDNEHHELAVVIEFLHTATLLHDDVVDASDLRRGQLTANATWGNAASVLTGDFLYSRAFQLLAQRERIPVMKILARTTHLISEGEMLQLMNRHDAALSETEYRKIIRRKTAELYSAAAHIGGLIATDKIELQQALANYGLHLGMAFQIIDDLLDYVGDHTVLGKNIGDDLVEGKMTLPLIYAIQQSDEVTAHRLKEIIKNPDRAQIPFLIQAIQNTHALSDTFAAAKREIVQAKAELTKLPTSIYRDQLTDLADFVIKRNF